MKRQKLSNSIFGIVFGTLIQAFLSSAISAESIGKTFEFGLGTQYAHSAMRSFPVPCGLSITATIKFQRSGPDNANSDVPIKIDLREPDTAEGVEGPIVRTESAFVTRTQQTKMITSTAKVRGCALPWRLRVRHANDGPAPLAITGTITVSFNDALKTIAIPTGFQVRFGTPETFNLGPSGGLNQGRVQIKANWIHDLLGLPGPVQIRLEFSILDPQGNVVARASGCSSDAFDTSCRFSLTYRVAANIAGQWKLKIRSVFAGTNPITNESYNAVAKVTPVVTFLPGCP